MFKGQVLYDHDALLSAASKLKSALGIKDKGKDTGKESDESDVTALMVREPESYDGESTRGRARMMIDLGAGISSFLDDDDDDATTKQQQRNITHTTTTTTHDDTTPTTTSTQNCFVGGRRAQTHSALGASKNEDGKRVFEQTQSVVALGCSDPTRPTPPGQSPTVHTGSNHTRHNVDDDNNNNRTSTSATFQSMSMCSLFKTAAKTSTTTTATATAHGLVCRRTTFRERRTVTQEESKIKSRSALRATGNLFPALSPGVGLRHLFLANQ